MHVDEAIRTRRTQKTYTGGSIPRETIAELLDLAVRAPNHGLTQPWRFVVVRGAGLARLAEAVAAAQSAGAKAGDDGGRLAKKQLEMGDRIRKAGAVIYVQQVRAADPVVDREDYAAVSCAVYGILLGATGRGLASYWSTAKMLFAPGVRALLGLPADDVELTVGAVFLGKGEAARELPRTAALEKARFFEE